MKIGVLVVLLLIGACAEETTTTTLTAYRVEGYAHAGPVCPVESTPPDPACADRPVDGAVIQVLAEDGGTVVEVTTGIDGRFAVDLPQGTYTLVPQPVDGLMGTPQPVEIVVTGPVTDIDLAYDTGIR